jgi:DNA-binding transcriptional LysR family regulator
VTSAGRDVQRRIDDLLDRYDTLLTDIADLQAGLSGVLKIGYNAPIAPAFLPDLSAPMLATHPDLSLILTECDNTTAQKGLLEGQFDIIIFVAEFPNPQIETQTLVFAPTYCLCPANHAFARVQSVTLSQIASEPLILLDRPAARGHYLEMLERSGEPFHIVATANATEMVRSLVATGLGVALLNMRPRQVQPYAGGETRCLPISGSTSGISLSLGFAPGPRRRMVQMFIDACTAYFAGPEGDRLIVTKAS